MDQVLRIGSVQEQGIYRPSQGHRSSGVANSRVANWYSGLLKVH